MTEPKTQTVTPNQIQGDIGLTDGERSVLAATANAWNAWCSLPDRALHDDDEFMRTIHSAQQLIALRVARRVNPDVWR
jgi:acyl-CoA synthetase (AMP-forming)/AMP-acid ligase II